MRFGRIVKWLLVFGLLSFVVAGSVAFAAWRAALGPEGSYFDSGGIRIHYTDEGRGTPLLLVHGFANPSGSWQWRRTGRIAALSKTYRVIALDNRGHGRSEKPHDPSQYGMEMVEDLVRLLDHLNIPKAHIVGYSMGGFIVLKMVVTHPDRIISAAACAAGWERSTPESRAFAESVAKALERGDATPLAARLGIEKGPLTIKEKLAMKAYFSYFNDSRALAAAARGSVEMHLTEQELKTNQVPTLTIIGTEDGLLPEAKSLAQVMKCHELFILEGRDHMNCNVSAGFLKKLLSFLENHTPRNSPS